MRRSRISEIFIQEGLKWRHEETWFGTRVDPDFAQKRGRSSSSTRRHRPAASSSASTRWGRKQSATPPISASAPTPARILMKTSACRSCSRSSPAAVNAARLRAAVRLLLRALDQDLFRDADAGLRADRLGDLLQVERRDRRRAGLPNVPYPSLDWIDALPLLGGLRVGDKFYLIVLAAHRASAFALLQRVVGSPFGRVLTAIRENPERAEFIGDQRAALPARRLRDGGRLRRASPARCSASSIAASSRISPTGPKSAEVLIMTILGGMGISGARRSARPC